MLAAGGFLAVRAIGLLALVWSPDRAGRSIVEVLSVWDGGWYVRIAENGYAGHLDLSAPLIDQSTGSLAFFPFYPALIRVLSALTGLDPRWTGVAISLTAGAIAAAGICVLARDWAGDRVGLLAALLWAAAPMGVVGTIVYSEALFTALTAWAFVALRARSWLTAGLLGALAGLTRPTGLAVGLAVAGYAGWTWWRGRRGVPATGSEPAAVGTYGSSDPGTSGSSQARADLPRPLGVRPWVAGLLALSATPAFWLAIGARAGRWDGWFAVQREFWGSRFDGGASVLELAGRVLTGTMHPGTGAVSVAVLACAIAAVVLLALAVRRRVWWPLIVYGTVSLIMVLGSAGYFSSKPRLLVPVFILAFPLARGLARRPAATQAVALLVAVAATTIAGTYLLLSWPYAI